MMYVNLRCNAYCCLFVTMDPFQCRLCTCMESVTGCVQDICQLLAKWSGNENKTRNGTLHADFRTQAQAYASY